jgi:hypothetical protein
MARVRVCSGRRLLPMAGFFISAAAAALITSSALSTIARDGAGAPSTPQQSPFRLAGTSTAFKLTTPPAAFTIHRLVRLANAADVTRWAPVFRPTVARREPGFGSAPAGRLPTRTGDGTTNIVVADEEAEHHGVLWVRVRLAVLPNGTEGWVPRSSLGGWWFVDTRLVIDRARLTATLLEAGRVIFRTPVAVGAPGTPTPAGRFYVLDRLSGFSRPFYGPVAFGTNARSPTLTDWPDGGVIGIHGTDRPGLIPGRVSHGCVRLANAAIIRLGKLMPVGTAVTIK